MRLTKKELMSVINQPMCFGSRLVGKKMFAQIIKELCEYKTIEEEFGVDLITLFKALKNGVYCYKRSIKDFNANGKRLGDIIHIPNFDIHIHFFGCYKKKRMGVSIMGCIDYVYHSLPLNEYGKTWALTKEELL